MEHYISAQLAHLSDDQIDNMLKDYYQKKKISDIIKKYRINITSSKFSTILPYKSISEEMVCNYCGEQLFIKYLSSKSPNTTEYVCRNCGHKPNNTDCCCNGCKEFAEQVKREENRKKEIFIRELLKIDEEKMVDYKTLTFEQKVYLGAFLRGGIHENYSYIKSINSFETPLAPTVIYQDEIITELRKQRLITIHPNTEMECFLNIDPEGNTTRFLIDKVWWYLNIKSSDIPQTSLIDSIINPDFKYDDNDAFELWKKIALHESLEYLIHSIKRVFNIDYNVGEKTISVIYDLLVHYSVAQIYYIIYHSTNHALRYKQENNIPYQQAANSIIARMQSLGERALNKGWELENYNRNKDCEQSIISKFFFERILKIDEKGFYQKPHIITTQE